MVPEVRTWTSDAIWRAVSSLPATANTLPCSRTAPSSPPVTAMPPLGVASTVTVPEGRKVVSRTSQKRARLPSPSRSLHQPSPETTRQSCAPALTAPAAARRSAPHVVRPSILSLPRRHTPPHVHETLARPRRFTGCRAVSGIEVAGPGVGAHGRLQGGGKAPAVGDGRVRLDVRGLAPPRDDGGDGIVGETEGQREIREGRRLP